MVKPFGGNPIFGKHSPYGYANLGFKAIATPSLVHKVHKYSDQDLYKVIASKPQLETQGFKIPKSELRELVSTHSCELSQRFSLQKAGNTIAECEDIWHYAESDRQFSIALSDGATESSFAREWAEELVRSFVKRDVSSNQDDCEKRAWLLPLQTYWQQWLASQNLSWFAKRKAEQGAFATFVSLEIFPNKKWKSLAVGDSCVFILRDRQLHKSFPLQSSQEFNNRPRLIGTHLAAHNISILQIEGDWQNGDRFYLVTDAIACWILKQLEANQDPWVKLEQIKSQEAFAEFVNDLRDRHEMANDDTTLLCLEIKDAPEISPEIPSEIFCES
ncbi:protein phosphatase 2C domain-containing protein [Pseudanabaena sp. FACHB-1998]|uniref:protein phosphatase 2C domain-containing protein n=1 Tax=Pseudanabaena sp. FACHB-1998 TaxID=2692858 RepID=UPI001680F43A